MQDWILSDASINTRHLFFFFLKQESLSQDGNSVLEPASAFYEQCEPLDFDLLRKWWRRALTWIKRGWQSVETTEFLGEDNADQLDIIMLDDTDCKVLHQAWVSTAIPRLEVFQIHWKYVLQGVGGSGKENCPSIIRGFDMSDLPGPLETMG